MAFKYIFSGLFTGQPTDIRNYYLENMYTTDKPDAFSNQNTNTTALTVSTANIAVAVTAAQEYFPELEYFVWDLEGLAPRVDNRNLGQTITNLGWTGVLTDAIINTTLDAFESLYNAIKAELIVQGLPNVKVGFYGLFARNYFYSVLPEANAAARTAMLNTYPRFNQRGVSGSYSTKNLSTYSDFITCDVYPYYGPDDPDYYTYAADVIDTTAQLAIGVPLYAFYQMYFHSTTLWSGKVVTGYNVADTVAMMKEHCDGIVMWGGYGSSFNDSNAKYTHNGTKDILAWRGVTNGAFTATVSNYTIPVTGCDFSSMIVDEENPTNLTVAAAYLQSYINTAIETQVNSRVPTIVARPALGGEYFPLKTGPVTVSWDSTPAFYFTNLGGTGPYGSSSPPDANHRQIRISATSLTSGAYTNLGASAWVGSFVSVDDGASQRNSNEFGGGWVLGTDWWEEFVNLAAADHLVDHNSYGEERSSPNGLVGVNGRIYTVEQYQKLLEAFGG